VREAEAHPRAPRNGALVPQLARPDHSAR
jgi:hypothetical protein